VAELRLHSRVVHTVFDLLGDKEDDITYSLGWALAQSDDLVRAVLGELFPGDVGSPSAIRLQESVPGAGRTDIELETQRVHLVVEAKRGWQLETEAKLKQYTARFEKDNALQPTIVVVSECSPEWATPRLPSEVADIPVRFLPWRRVAQLVEHTATHLSFQHRETAPTGASALPERADDDAERAVEHGVRGQPWYRAAH
jgi:hypothetical protein